MSEEELEAIIEKARIDRSSILNLSRNQLTNLPESIGNLSNLIELSLSDNQLQSLPKSIARLSNLKKIDLGNNQLKRLPDSICQLSNLRYLSLVNNQLEILPDSIGQLSSITNLYLFKNQLRSLPESIEQFSILSNLQNVERFYDEDTEIEISREPMVLLKMTCPHIHILRVLPEITSAEAAITWVNHGIHPDEFAVQT